MSVGVSATVLPSCRISSASALPPDEGKLAQKNTEIGNGSHCNFSAKTVGQTMRIVAALPVASITSRAEPQGYLRTALNTSHLQVTFDY